MRVASAAAGGKCCGWSREERDTAALRSIQDATLGLQRAKALGWHGIMLGIYCQSIPRRGFLRTSFLARAAVVWHGCGTAPSASVSAGREIHLALLSDTHVAGDRELGKDPRGFDPWENVTRVVPDIIARPPCGVILNGDAASREGFTADYQEIKNPQIPASALIS